MMKIKVLIPFVFFVIIISCQKEVYLEIKSDNVIVVNSILSPDSLILVHVSKSQDLNDSSQEINLNNADVSIYGDSSYPNDLLLQSDGLYVSNFTPTAGVNYTIEVNSEPLSFVTSTTIIPDKPVIENVYVEDKLFQDFNFCLKITLKEDGSVSNYYRLKLRGYVVEYDYTTIDPETGNYHILNERFSDVLFFINDPKISISNNNSSSEIINSILGTYETGLDVVNWIAFSDQNINGSIHTIELYVVDNINLSEDKPLYIELETINQDYYYYLYSISNTNSYLVDQISTNNSVFSNIENGAGIFSATNMAIDSIISFK